MRHTKKEIRFGKRANEYDNGFEGKFLNKFYKKLIEEVKLSEYAKYLDVACGTGELLCRMDEAYNMKGYGIDIDPQMITVAKKKCPQMDIRTGYSDQLPYDDGIFDTISVCMAYHHFENRKGFENESKRVLKKGGKIYIAELKLPNVLRNTFNALLRHRHVVAQFFTSEEIARNFESSGFEFIKSTQSGLVQIVCLRKV